MISTTSAFSIVARLGSRSGSRRDCSLDSPRTRRARPEGNRSSRRARSSSVKTIPWARATDCAVSTRVGPGMGTTSARQVAQPGQRDLERRGAVARRESRQHGIRDGAAPALRTAERPVRQQPDAVRDAVLGHAAQNAVVVPDAQLGLDGGNLGDAPRLLDLSDVHIAETDRLDQAVAFQRGERPDAGRERRSRVGRMELIEMDAIDAERAPAGLARGDEMTRPPVRDPAALRTCETALGRHQDARSGRRSSCASARAIRRSLCPASLASQQ